MGVSTAPCCVCWKSALCRRGLMQVLARERLGWRPSGDVRVGQATFCVCASREAAMVQGANAGRGSHDDAVLNARARALVAQRQISCAWPCWAAPIAASTALFNLLTGARQKVANYAGCDGRGVKRARCTRPVAARCACWICPVPTALHAHSLDEAITHVTSCVAAAPARPLPDLLVCVTDATHLRLNLRLVLESPGPGPAHGAGAEHERHGRAPGHSD